MSLNDEEVKIESLNLKSKQINLTVKVLSKTPTREIISRSDGSKHSLSNALVGDETGCIYLTLWDDNIERVKEGETIVIKNGYVSLFKGSMRLNVGKYGSIEHSEKQIEGVNEENNLSNKIIKREPHYYPKFQPLYKDDYRNRRERRRYFRRRR
jgi:replication factor A1